jgi:hypothetical protein
MYKFSCYLWNARIIILVQEKQEMNLMTAAVQLQQSLSFYSQKNRSSADERFHILF